ncbi:hypothetical protein GPX89_31480 [Nocardia sp. ET3-3]|uniref:Uncharacterized protein n=1 Tax=Nocardia terrae TaxID=2675851 RepID=A0A7K1V570_9NOCA|nr:hypothetical protein [Nocardia terrae]MVU81746.1 hypothetical protein [Nocardia terrae]
MKFSKATAYAVAVAAVSGGVVLAPVAQAAVGSTPIAAHTTAGQDQPLPGCGECQPDPM